MITPYDSIENVAANSFPKFLIKLILADKYKTIEISGQLQNSVLLVVAEKDNIIPVKHALNLYDNIFCTKKITLIGNADHNNISGFPEYWKAIKEFIED